MPSPHYHILHRLIPSLNLFGDDQTPIAVIRQRIEKNARRLCPPRGVTVTPVDAGGVPAEWVLPKNVAQDAVLLYIHGGGFAICSPATHRHLVAGLARAGGMRSLSLDYRLSPEYPFPAALEDCLAAYRWLIYGAGGPDSVHKVGLQSHPYAASQPPSPSFASENGPASSPPSSSASDNGPASFPPPSSASENGPASFSSPSSASENRPASSPPPFSASENGGGSGRGYSPSRIILAGDSAGGNLALSMMLALRGAGDPLPAAAVLLSPVTDLVGTGESLFRNAGVDVMLGQGPKHLIVDYYGSWNPRHPLISPLYGDLRGLPPLLFHVGEDEILLDDSLRMAEVARQAGVDARVVVWPRLWHVFQAFAPILPEGRQSIEQIGEFLRRHI